jgi:hypothetical protein
MRVGWDTEYKHVTLDVTDSLTGKPVSVWLTPDDALQLLYRIGKRFHEQECPKVAKERGKWWWTGGASK